MKSKKNILFLFFFCSSIKTMIQHDVRLDFSLFTKLQYASLPQDVVEEIPPDSLDTISASIPLFQLYTTIDSTEKIETIIKSYAQKGLKSSLVSIYNNNIYDTAFPIVEVEEYLASDFCGINKLGLLIFRNKDILNTAYFHPSYNDINAQKKLLDLLYRLPLKFFVIGFWGVKVFSGEPPKKPNENLFYRFAENSNDYINQLLLVKPPVNLPKEPVQKKPPIKRSQCTNTSRKKQPEVIEGLQIKQKEFKDDQTFKRPEKLRKK